MAPVPPTLAVRRADLDDAADRERAVVLVDAFSRTPTGRARPLAAEEAEGLRRMLGEAEGVRVFFAEESGNPDPVGIAVCSLQPKTFSGRYKLNVHDLVVVEGRRGEGIGRRLLAGVVEHAEAAGHHSVTLEVLTDNLPARKLYRSLGFGPTEPEEAYWVRPLDASPPS